ncbi:hypothetical protein HK101_006717, partial [Irineochytrium annulatum]
AEEVAAYQTEVPWTVFAGDTEVEGHVWRTLTDVDRHQAALEFLIQPRHDYLLAIAGATDWELTFWILHDGNFVWGPGTTRGDTARRRYSVQALTRQLPAQGELWRRRPQALESARQAVDAGLHELLAAVREQAPAARRLVRERWAEADYLGGDLEGQDPPGGEWWSHIADGDPPRVIKWVDLARGVVPHAWQAWLMAAGITATQATTRAIRAAHRIKWAAHALGATL